MIEEGEGSREHGVTALRKMVSEEASLEQTFEGGEKMKKGAMAVWGKSIYSR